MKYKKLTGTKVPRFTYDTPHKADNDFYALCAGEMPLAMVFLSNFGHPISRAYLNAYLQTAQSLTAGRLACVVRSDPQRIAAQLGNAELPFTVICDVDGVLYDYFEVGETNRFLDWTFAARRIVKAAKKEGYAPEKGASHLLPLTMFLGQEGEVLYAHRGRSLTDLPEDCVALEEVCLRLAARKQAVAPQAQEDVALLEDVNLLENSELLLEPAVDEGVLSLEEPECQEDVNLLEETEAVEETAEKAELEEKKEIFAAQSEVLLEDEKSSMQADDHLNQLLGELLQKS